MSKTRLRRDTSRESYDFLKVPNHEREIQIFTKLENQPIFEFFKIRIKDKTMEILMVKSDLKSDVARESYDFLKVPNEEREIQVFTKLENQPIFEIFKIRIEDETTEILMVKSDFKSDVAHESYDFLKVPNEERDIQIVTRLESQPIFHASKTRIEVETTRIPMVKSDFESDVALESCDFLKVPNQEREIQIFHESCRNNSEIHEKCRETHTHP